MFGYHKCFRKSTLWVLQCAQNAEMGRGWKNCYTESGTMLLVEVLFIPFQKFHLKLLSCLASIHSSRTHQLKQLPNLGNNPMTLSVLKINQTQVLDQMGHPVFNPTQVLDWMRHCTYRVTIQLVANFPLTSKPKFRFGLACGTFVL